MTYLTFKYISIDFSVYSHNYKIRIEYFAKDRERQETYITRIIVRVFTRNISGDSIFLAIFQIESNLMLFESRSLQTADL